MVNEVKPCYQFGSFRLDLQKRLLLENDVPVELAGKNLDVLSFLLRNSGEVVKKDDLLNHFWPNLNTAEGSLTQAIHKIRHALGDTKKPYKFIVNQSGEGYLVIVPVKLIEPDDPATGIEKSGAGELAPITTRARLTIERVETEVSILDRPQGPLERFADRLSSLIKLYPKATVTTLCAFGVVVLSLGLWNAENSHRPEPPRTRRSIVLVNERTEPGNVREDGQLSHDGKMLAYTSTRNGRSGIWVKQINNSTAIPISVDVNSWGPRWSPDDLNLAYLSNADKQTTLWTKPALGGEPTLITTFNYDPDKPSVWELRSWSTIDPSKIYLEFFHNLFRLDLNTKRVEKITSFDASRERPSYFEVSPNEKIIAYVDSKDKKYGIYLSSLDGKSAVLLSPQTSNCLFPEWLADGSAVMYTSRINGFDEIFITSIRDHSTRQLTGDNADHRVTTVGSNGTTTVDLIKKDEAHLWGLNPKTHIQTLYTTDGGLQIWPVPAPDNAHVLFQSVSGNSGLFESEIVSKELTGARKTSKLVSGGTFFSVSPNGEQVAFLRLKGSSLNLWIANLADGSEKQLSPESIDDFGFSQIPVNRLVSKDPAWSPNSKAIVVRVLKNGFENLWEISPDTGNHVQITDNVKRYVQYSDIRYSPDGKRLALVEIESFPGGDRAWSLTIVENGKPRVLLQRVRALRLLGWLPNGDSMIVASDEQSGENISTPTGMGLNIISVKGDDLKSIPAINSAYFISAALSPNGQEIALVCRHDGIDNIWTLSLIDGSAQMITGNFDPTLYITGLTWSQNGDTIFFSKQECVSTISLIDNLF